MSFSQIIALLSGVALFLYGMTLMGDGMKKVAGNRLSLVLYRLSDTPLKGLVLGTAVTAVIQSSAATSVMVVGFVNSGMMKPRQAVSVILGAILGTSITGWITSLSYLQGGSGLQQVLSTATLSGIVAFTGILLRMTAKKNRQKKVGDILMGFAVLMFGMSMMSGAVRDLGEQPWFTSFLTSLSHPLPGIAVGAVFTGILQSASAAVGILQALSVTGAMTFETALPLLMGVAIGASFPVLLSALGANTSGKRTAMVYLVSTASSVMVCSAVFYIANACVRFSLMTAVMDPFALALVNMILRLVMVLLLIPFTDVLEAVVNVLVKDRDKSTERLVLHLEERFINHPALAIEQSRLSINAMAKSTYEALALSFDLIDQFDEKKFEKVEQLESDVDKYEDSLGSYFVKLTGRELTREQNEAVSEYLHTLTDFERISDHAMDIAESAVEIRDKNVSFSAEGKHELTVIRAAVLEIVRMTTEAFINQDLALAHRVEPLEERIDLLCDEMKMHHVERLQKGMCTIAQGFVFNDLLTYFERVGDHCSNVAVAMIELNDDSFDTHRYLNQLKKAHTPEFQQCLEEYIKEFEL